MISHRADLALLPRAAPAPSRPRTSVSTVRGGARDAPALAPARLRPPRHRAARVLRGRPGPRRAAHAAATSAAGRAGLDSQRGPVPLHDGLLSRDGWSFIDDSRAPLLARPAAAGFDARPARRAAYQDGYLFGYGHDYTRGARRLPPPLRAGAAAAAQGVRRLVLALLPVHRGRLPRRLLPAFRRERVPLDVLVVDTDFKAPRSWNGWSWNARALPRPAAASSAWRTTRVSTSTSTCTRASAERSAASARRTRRAGGLIAGDRAGRSARRSSPPRRSTSTSLSTGRDRAQLDSYFALHEPFERDGVDFWWLDWCCEEARAGPLPEARPRTPGSTRSTRAATPTAAALAGLARIGGSFEDWTRRPAGAVGRAPRRRSTSPATPSPPGRCSTSRPASTSPRATPACRTSRTTSAASRARR